MILYSRRGALSSKFILGKWGGDALAPVPGKPFIPFCSFNEWNELGVGAKLFFFMALNLYLQSNSFLKYDSVYVWVKYWDLKLAKLFTEIVAREGKQSCVSLIDIFGWRQAFVKALIGEH